MSILPDNLVLPANKLRPQRLSNGVLQKQDKREKLVGYELLRVLNGMKVGYDLDYTLDSNRLLNAYVPINRKIRNYTPSERQMIEDIFTLAQTNSMYYVPAENRNWAIYFLEENTNLGMLLAFYLIKVHGNYLGKVPQINGLSITAELSSIPRSLVSDYVISRLQGYSLEDIEANIFCYRNGTNIQEQRRINRANYLFIQQAGNKLINDMQQSDAFSRFVTEHPPQLLTISTI